MRTTWPAATIVLAAIVVPGLASCGEKGMKMPALKVPEALRPDTPEEKARKQIAAVLAAEDQARFHREVSDLLFLARDLKWDSRRLLAEVVDYAARVQGPQGEQRYVQLLRALELPRTSLVDVAASRLDGSPADAPVARALLAAAAPADAGAPVDFSHFRPYLEARAARPPEKLILWMVERDPGSALRLMADVYGGASLSPDRRRELLIAERVIDSLAWAQRHKLPGAEQAERLAAEQVARLAALEPWWARLYAAEVLARYPALRTADLVKALSSDANALVRQTARRAS